MDAGTSPGALPYRRAVKCGRAGQQLEKLSVDRKPNTTQIHYRVIC
jgi:hypothetical protein